MTTRRIRSIPSLAALLALDDTVLILEPKAAADLVVLMGQEPLREGETGWAFGRRWDVSGDLLLGRLA